MKKRICGVALMALVWSTGCASDGGTQGGASNAGGGAAKSADGQCSHASEQLNPSEFAIQNQTASDIYIVSSGASAAVVVDGAGEEYPLASTECLQDCEDPLETVFCSAPTEPFVIRIIAGGKFTLRWPGVISKLRTIPAACGNSVEEDFTCFQRVAPQDGAIIRFDARSEVECPEFIDDCTCDPGTNGSCIITESISNGDVTASAEVVYSRSTTNFSVDFAD